MVYYNSLKRIGLERCTSHFEGIICSTAKRTNSTKIAKSPKVANPSKNSAIPTRKTITIPNI